MDSKVDRIEKALQAARLQGFCWLYFSSGITI